MERHQDMQPLATRRLCKVWWRTCEPRRSLRLCSHTLCSERVRRCCQHIDFSLLSIRGFRMIVSSGVHGPFQALLFFPFSF